MPNIGVSLPKIISPGAKAPITIDVDGLNAYDVVVDAFDKTFTLRDLGNGKWGGDIQIPSNFSGLSTITVVISYFKKVVKEHVNVTIKNVCDTSVDFLSSIGRKTIPANSSITLPLMVGESVQFLHDNESLGAFTIDKNTRVLQPTVCPAEHVLVTLNNICNVSLDFTYDGITIPIPAKSKKTVFLKVGEPVRFTKFTDFGNYEKTFTIGKNTKVLYPVPCPQIKMPVTVENPCDVKVEFHYGLNMKSIPPKQSVTMPLDLGEYVIFYGVGQIIGSYFISENDRIIKPNSCPSLSVLINNICNVALDFRYHGGNVTIPPKQEIPLRLNIGETVSFLHNGVLLESLKVGEHVSTITPSRCPTTTTTTTHHTTTTTTTHHTTTPPKTVIVAVSNTCSEYVIAHFTLHGQPGSLIIPGNFTALQQVDVNSTISFDGGPGTTGGFLGSVTVTSGTRSVSPPRCPTKKTSTTTTTPPPSTTHHTTQVRITTPTITRPPIITTVRIPTPTITTPHIRIPTPIVRRPVVYYPPTSHVTETKHTTTKHTTESRTTQHPAITHVPVRKPEHIPIFGRFRPSPFFEKRKP